jgi:hypothetical protein
VVELLDALPSVDEDSSCNGQGTLADLEPIVPAYRAGEFTAAGVVKASGVS